MSLSSILGNNKTTTARITSGIVSIIILGFLYISKWIVNLPEKVIDGAFILLAIHLVNQLYVAISELETKYINKKKK